MRELIVLTAVGVDRHDVLLGEYFKYIFMSLICQVVCCWGEKKKRRVLGTKSAINTQVYATARPIVLTVGA